MALFLGLKQILLISKAYLIYKNFLVLPILIRNAHVFETPYMENLLSTLFYFPLIDVFSFFSLQLQALKDRGAKKRKISCSGQNKRKLWLACKWLDFKPALVCAK